MDKLYIILLFFFLSLTSQAQTYVKHDAQGLGNGLSWINAYTDIQTAINASNAGDEIWISKGTYYPESHPMGCNSCFNSRDNAFLLKDGVAIYGGFNGTETQLSERNWNANPTILSGDIDGVPDVVTGEGATLEITGNEENAYHVVIAANTGPNTILDGFTITGGNGGLHFNINVNGNIIRRSSGGGMHNVASFASLKNIIFTGNESLDKGGGIYNGASSPTMTNIRFVNNISGNNGGGMYNSNASPYMENISFGNNKSDIGAGIFNFFSSPKMEKILFRQNHANLYGGGIYNSSSSPSMNNIDFKGNSAQTGGGVVNFSSSSPLMTNITIEENSADFGGGMYNYSNATPTIMNATIANNYAGLDGAGIYNVSCLPVFTNVAVINNQADRDGGGVYNYLSSANIAHMTLVNNIALENGGGIYNRAASPDLVNCIIWYNSALTSPTIHNVETSMPNISYSIFTGINEYLGDNNINAKPMFMDLNHPKGVDGIYRTPDDGISLSLCSPAIDNGKNLPTIIETDITGKERIFANTVDIGAYEPEWLVKFDAIPNTAGRVSKATVERTDILGWTHYLDGNNDCEWLLSLKKETEDIGRIGDGTFLVSHEITADYGEGKGIDLSIADYIPSGSWHVMNRSWTVDVTNEPSSDLMVRFPYHSTDFNDLIGSFEVDNHQGISFYNVGDTWEPYDLDIETRDFHRYRNGEISSSTTWLYGNPSEDIHYAEYRVSSLSGGSAGVGTMGNLPVELLYFYAVEKNQSSVLKWGTETEEYNKGFHIEHSLDGISFERIGWVDGHNYSQEEQTYDFTHLAPEDGNNYYRLVQEDFDGTQELSGVEVLYFEKKKEINLFPNLITQSQNTLIKFNLEMEADVLAEIYNYSGQLVSSEKYFMTAGNNIVKLDVSNLPSNIYSVNISWEGESENFRLVIVE